MFCFLRLNEVVWLKVWRSLTGWCYVFDRSFSLKGSEIANLFPIFWSKNLAETVWSFIATLLPLPIKSVNVNRLPLVSFLSEKKAIKTVCKHCVFGSLEYVPHVSQGLWLMLFSRSLEKSFHQFMDKNGGHLSLSEWVKLGQPEDWMIYTGNHQHLLVPPEL